MPDGKLLDPNVISSSGECGRQNLPRGYGPTGDSMMHDRSRAEPHAASGFSDAILELGILEASAVLKSHPLVSLKPYCLLPQTEPVEEAPGNSHVPAKYILRFPQPPFLTVVQQPRICQGRLIKPIGPATEIVRDRNDGTAGQYQRVHAPSKEVVIRLGPMRLNSHVIVGEQQQRGAGHPHTGILPSAEAKARLAGGSGPPGPAAPPLSKRPPAPPWAQPTGESPGGART